MKGLEKHERRRNHRRRTSKALAETLGAVGIECAVLQQDDYFVHPPKTNDATRRQDISWVGTGEVRLELLNSHLVAAQTESEAVITKPLVIYDEDRITEETISLAGAQVVIAEGTYTSLLKNADARVFIARNRLETMAGRERPGDSGDSPGQVRERSRTSAITGTDGSAAVR